MTTDPTNQQANQQADQQADQPTYHAAYQPTPSPRRLVRRTDDKMLGGVCAGLADYLGLDRTLVRVLAVLATVLGAGSVIVAYLVAWVIVPKDIDAYPAGPGAGAAATARLSRPAAAL
ncbi:MAG TPA: PspC domain-containing protein [Nocardioides sp.]|uniref:PspC domain-containing protein n=1 Tax=Nocardioides sp. TaxID=35761 RepID=UPI002E3277E2|nr:PspC domain-containing protein [Nocardioides sp.]HEX5090113.1 PspC domain-containing protein [Nocardioides sp.]